MKRWLALFVVLLLMGATWAQAELPEMKDGAVTIPWNDFKELLDRLQVKPATDEPEPPVDFVLGRGSLRGVLAGGQLDLKATYPLAVLKNGWVTVPLTGVDTPLADVLLDGRTAPITDQQGNVTLIVKGPANHSLTLRYRMAAPDRPGPGHVSVQLPRAAGQVLTIVGDKKYSSPSVDGATMSRGPGGVTTAILTGDQLSLRYTVALEQKQATQEKLPPKVLVENHTLVSIDEGFIRAVVQLAFEVRHAPVTEFRVVVPEGFEVADCSGASLAGWKVDPATRELTATIGFDVQGKYNLTLVLERSTKNESFEFLLPGTSVQSVERERGFFAVQVTGGVEVTTTGEVDGLQTVDAKELPAGLRGGATNPIVMSFKYLRHPFSAKLRVVRHKTQNVLGAAIDAANFVVQVTEDGDLVTRALYTVRNNRKQFLELTLPYGENTALWSTFVANKPVRPSQTKEGKILLPLEKSGYSGAELSSFTVEVIYYANLGSSFGVLGSMHLLLPKVDLPISQSALTVFAPNRFEYQRVGGSMRAPYQAPASGLLSRVMEEQPPGAPTALPPPPAKRAGADRAKARPDEYMLQQSQAEMEFQKRIRAAQQATDSGGALPARFAVPKKGAALRFEELVTIGEASDVRLMYGAKRLSQFGALAALLLAAALVWFARSIFAMGRVGHYLLAVGVVVLAVMAALGISIGYAIGGVLLAAAALLVRAVYRRIARKMGRAI
ncbi:MAG: hypothetical protein P9L99_21035 [Candidatus Lernaella stagnicola]|nr:hypothetical protein [Candidatus Lernaella stagnicola]